MGENQNNSRYCEYQTKRVVKVLPVLRLAEAYDCWEILELSEWLADNKILPNAQGWNGIEGKPLYFSYKCRGTKSGEAQIGFQVNTYAGSEFHEFVGRVFVPRIQKALGLKSPNLDPARKYTKYFEWEEKDNPHLSFDLVMEKGVPEICKIVSELKASGISGQIVAANKPLCDSGAFVRNFDALLDEMKKQYEATLTYMKPAKDNRYFKEANLTSYFIKAVAKIRGNILENAVHYDEFPISQNYRPGVVGKKLSDSIDSVFFDLDANRLFVVEAKDTGSNKMWNSISWDMLRTENAIKGSNSLPPHFQQVLKGSNGRLLTADEYEKIAKYGLIISGYWIKNGCSGDAGLAQAQNDFKVKLENASNPRLDFSIKLSEIGVREVAHHNPALMKPGGCWRYYLLLYVWKV